MEWLKKICFLIITIEASVTCCIACPDVCRSVKTVCHVNERTNEDIQCRFISCPPDYEVKPCKRHCDQDLCVKCGDGYIQPENATSKTWEQTRCIPVIKCREDLERDPSNPNHCRCALSKGYFGSDPTNCQWNGPCPRGTELGKSGKCLTCQPGYFKKTNGLSLCIRQTHCASLDMVILSDGNATMDYECIIKVDSLTSEGTNATAKRHQADTESSILHIASHSLHLEIIIPVIGAVGILLSIVIKLKWTQIKNCGHSLIDGSTIAINVSDKDEETTVGCKNSAVDTVALVIDKSERASLLDEENKRPRPSMTDSLHSMSTGSTSLVSENDESPNVNPDNNDLLSNYCNETDSSDVGNDSMNEKESEQGQVQLQEARREELVPSDTVIEKCEDHDARTRMINSPPTEESHNVESLRVSGMDDKPLLKVIRFENTFTSDSGLGDLELNLSTDIFDQNASAAESNVVDIDQTSSKTLAI